MRCWTRRTAVVRSGRTRPTSPRQGKSSLGERGYKSRIHRKGSSRRKLDQQEQATNHRRSQVRACIEHVFGDQRTRQGSIRVSTKGKVRAAVKIGLMNLTYNMRRLEFLIRPQSAGCTG
jgi:IS5 family transposase